MRSRVSFPALAIALFLPFPAFGQEQPTQPPSVTSGPATAEESDPVICRTLPPAGASRLTKQQCKKQSEWQKLEKFWSRSNVPQGRAEPSGQ